VERNKRLICAIMVGAIVCSMAFAEEGSVEPTAEPTPAPVVEITPEPTQQPAEEQTAEPTLEPTEEPTAEPSVEPTAELTEEPSAEPTEEPSIEPTVGPTAEPSIEPTVEPTLTPTVEPTVAPTEAPAAIEIRPEGNAMLMEKVWQISYQLPEDEIKFSWQAVDGAVVYAVTIADSKNNQIHASQETEATVSLPASVFGEDTYTMTVAAYADQAQIPEGELVLQGEMMFVLVQGQFGPGGFPGGFPGGSFPSGGGFPDGNMQGGMMPEEQGLRITPGEALTSDHASGSKNMRAHGAVEVVPSTAEMTVLTLDGTALSVTLDDQQSAFGAAKEENVLVLTPAGEGGKWSVNAYALKVLNRSGIEAVRLMLGETAVELSTSWQPQGMVYAKLSAAGYVSKDYTLIVTQNDLVVTVEDQSYRINENNELVGG